MASNSTTRNSATRKDAALARQFRKAIIEKLDANLAASPDPDQPLIGSAGRRVGSLSRRDIVKHVKTRTPLGEKLVANWADLVLQNIKETPQS